MTVDVLVIGAGSAGLAAAVTAARSGARVALVERHGFAGGMGTASLVHTFCGLYLMGDGPPVIANPGFSEEIADRMMQATGAGGPVRMGRVWVLKQHPVDFARIADELLRENRVEVLFHTEAISAGRRNDGMWRVETACRGRLLGIHAGSLIDASGDAILSDLLGGTSEMTESVRLQRPAYVFGVQGVNGGEEGLALAGRIVDGVRRGILPEAALGLHFRASGRPGELFGTLDLSGEEGGAYDPLDATCLSGIEITGRAVATSALGFLKREALGWSGAWISQWPVRAGVRESRRWKGRHVLTGEEILRGVRHDDDIALAAWPLEFRETHRGPKLRYPDGDRAAGIPRGCLLPVAWDGLFVAGRCISCDHDAQASVRVMGTCFATGEAAGKVAVEFAERGREA